MPVAEETRPDVAILAPVYHGDRVFRPGGSQVGQHQDFIDIPVVVSPPTAFDQGFHGYSSSSSSSTTSSRLLTAAFTARLVLASSASSENSSDRQSTRLDSS